ncbi:hypothetical protein BC830DRAFT_187936 [Chytriomyces sp. MP71]|nr:hypothetical protein BC830DRAFT_187936 [Chytriomyces sp. MP71]
MLETLFTLPIRTFGTLAATSKLISHLVRLFKTAEQHRNFRVEMASSAIPQVYTVVQSAPATSAMLSGKASAIMFDIPTSFTIGQAYFVRLVPNDGIYGSLASNKNGVVTSTLSLPSASFTLFASSVIINPYLAVNITTSEATAPLPVSQPVTTYAGSQLTFSWKWSSKPPISSWQIDLFSIGQASSLYTGKTIASRIQGNTYAWSIDQDLPAGAYYARVWEGASAEEGTDPVSAVSAVFTLYNTETQPPLS